MELLTKWSKLLTVKITMYSFVENARTKKGAMRKIAPFLGGLNPLEILTL